MIPARLALEVTYQLERAEAHERLVRVLSAPPFFVSFFDGESRSYVLTLWKRLIELGFDPELAYTKSVEESRNSRILSQLLVRVIEFYRLRSNQELVHRGILNLKAVADRLRDRKIQADCDYQLCRFENERGDYEKALVFGGKALQYCMEVGDERKVSRLYGLLGNIYASQEKWDEALEWYSKHFDIAERINDQEGMGVSLASQAICFSKTQRFDDAIAFLNRCVGIFRRTADRNREAQVIGDLARTYSNLGRYQDAIVAYVQQLKISEELDDIFNIGLACGNMALTYISIRDFNSALRLFDSALEAHTRAGFPFGLAYWYYGIGVALAETAFISESDDLQEARRYALKSIEISEQLRKRDTILSSKILLARMDAAEGNLNQAAEILQSLLTDVKEDSDRTQIYYWLWKLCGDKDAAIHATQLSEKLWQATKAFEYWQWLAELHGEPIPSSAEDSRESDPV